MRIVERKKRKELKTLKKVHPRHINMVSQNSDSEEFHNVCKSVESFSERFCMSS
jgi:hypothetical protein